jgi:hypothetical protein
MIFGESHETRVDESFPMSALVPGLRLARLQTDDSSRVARNLEAVEVVVAGLYGVLLR